MTTVLKSIRIPTVEEFNDIVIGNIDENAKQWPLMSSPIYTLMILAGYLYFCTSLGRNFMEKRKPYTLDRIMITYNFIQILMNGYLFYKTSSVLFSSDYSFFESRIDMRPDRLFFVYLYFINKLIDLFDTIFMVLRKKNSQITFLHLYHHAMMPIIGWLYSAYMGAAISIFFGATNTLVHVIMYTYYLATNLNAEFKKSIWWKSRLTQLQLVQFILVTCHALVNFLNPKSEFPGVIVAVSVPQGFIMLILFLDFYKKAYNSKNKQQ
ncbi:elongation of very long chain fatty acids protein 7 [Nilaparvata lugens]|uniref:Elongation of very long chain fatty acids protein n=1 Tax=Nilaparvata lugens TaxID=108931 RepID=A0A3Q8FP41_NILLU|nr:elongation of very long chain fatty acids protein 7 [Nilaparvata lugens]AWJ25036.1 fatty acid elongase [Nilaparvata lugens]